MGSSTLRSIAVFGGALLGGCPDSPRVSAPAVVDLVLGDGPEARAYRLDVRGLDVRGLDVRGLDVRGLDVRGLDVRGLDVGAGRLEALAPAPSYPYEATPEGGVLLGVADDIVLRTSDGALHTVAASAGLDWHPRLHPDGRRLLFESSRESFRDLYLTFLDAPDRVLRLTDDPEGNFDGAWSPRGDRICFSSSRYGQLDLFVMNADGSEPTRWTRHTGDAVRCAFSPSGNAIAYVSARDGRDDVFAIRAPGAEPENLTRGLGGRGSSVARFAWHPDEERLLVGFERPGAVWLIGEGTRRRLTPPGSEDREPTWSPDGRSILVVRDGAPRGLVALDVRSGKTTSLHPDPSAWRPRWRQPARPRSPRP